MTPEASDAQGILDSMVRDSMASKTNASRKLTPVGTEKPMPPLAGVFPAKFPNDEPAEVVVAAVREVRRQLAIIDEAMYEAERVAVGEEKARENAGLAWRVTGREADIRDSQEVKREERAADERAARLTEKERESVEAPVADTELAILERLEGAEQRAAAFGVADAPTDGWVCPDHGSDALTTRKNIRREQFRACTAPGCKEFEGKK